MRKLLLISLLFSLTCQGQTPMKWLVKRSPSFSPSSITGLKLWVYAGSIELSDGDPVDTWDDQSGSGNTLTSSSTARPLYKTGILNSLPVVRFDGSNDVMSKASFSGVDGLSGMTIFLVVKQASLATNNIYLSKWDYATQGSFAWQTGDANSDEMTCYIAESTTSIGSNHSSSTTADLTTTFYVLEMVYDGSQTNTNRVIFYKNGSTVGSAADGGSTIATSLTTATSDLRLGQFGGALTRNFNGDFAEVLIYNSALNSTDRGNVRSYLQTKYGL